MRKPPIDKIIEKYSKEADGFADGVLAMARQLKGIRDEIQADVDMLWRIRRGSPPSAKVTLSVLKSILKRIDMIDGP